MNQPEPKSTIPIRDFIRFSKQRKRVPKVADSTGAELSGGSLLARTLVMRRLLRRYVYKADEKFIGLLLPPSLAGLVANMAVTIDHRVAVNLNYTVSSEIMNSCIEQCGIKHVVTSRKFMEKFDFEIDAELIYLEDLKDKPTVVDKLVAGFQSFLMPSWLLERHLRMDKIDPDDVVTIIFTSGSTGKPKGVMLTHANVAANVWAVDQAMHLTADDVLLGVLPFFHSFGYTITMWSAVNLNIMGVYHFNPLDGKQIGKLCEKFGVTLLITTPTFLRTYIKRCTKQQFAKLDAIITAAEKLPSTLCDSYEEKYGVRPVEGYGATELSPLATLNIPASRSTDRDRVDCKEGSVGRPVAGVLARIANLDTGEECGVGEPGMLWIKGRNVMAGYLDRPDLTAEVIVDGWYKTGDVALVDDEGFIHITGRVSRFSKIGGEMVPHIKIEEMLAEIIGDSAEDGLNAVVTAVPDPKKGERLVVLHLGIERTPQELCKALSESGLPNLFIPSPDSFHQVDEIPVLGTGKLDLQGIKKLAVDQFGLKE